MLWQMNKNFKKTLAQVVVGLRQFFFCCCVLELNFGWTGGNRSRDLKERVQLVKPEVRIPQLVNTASRKQLEYRQVERKRSKLGDYRK